MNDLADVKRQIAERYGIDGNDQEAIDDFFNTLKAKVSREQLREINKEIANHLSQDSISGIMK